MNYCFLDCSVGYGVDARHRLASNGRLRPLSPGQTALRRTRFHSVRGNRGPNSIGSQKAIVRAP